MTARPRAFSPRMMSNSAVTSVSVRAEVGSSMITSRALSESALAISTICCSATERERTIAPGFEVHPELVEQIGGLLAQLAPADDLAGVRLPPDEDVLLDREVGHEVELLIDDGDAEVLRLAGAVEDDRLAVEDDLAAVRLVDPGEDLHQGALAGAVLADEPEDFAGMDFETDVLQSEHAGEALA